MPARIHATATADRGRAIRVLRVLATVVAMSVAGLLLAPAASAQVPETPDIPSPVADAVATAQETLIPVMVDASQQAQSVANAGGFALRPGCAGVGTAVLLAVLLGGSLPFSPGFISTPVLIFCAGAFAPGPVDPVFGEVDTAAGSALEGAAAPVLTQVGTALAPARPQLADVCGAIALAGSTPNQVPPPLNRFNVTRTVCQGA